MKGGKIIDYEFAKDNCPKELDLGQLPLFDDWFLVKWSDCLSSPMWFAPNIIQAYTF